MKELIVKTSDFLNVKYFNKEIVCNNCAFEGIDQPLDITINLRAEKTDDVNVYFSGNVKGTFELECSRCLKTFKIPFNITLSFDMDFDNSGTIDIAEEIRQLIIVDLPAKPLCSDNCAGIEVANTIKQTDETGEYDCISSIENTDFIKERWKEVLNNIGGNNAKSKKKTHS